MAVKIVRQPKQIALIGAPSSAAAHGPGHERAPSALRAAGLVEKLEQAGYEVTDLGDTEVFPYQPDEENPRARNVGAVVAALHALKPRVEQAVKSGALPVILGGDCVIALATVAGIRRYYRGASLIYVDRDADLNVPATSPSGCVDGMVISHAIGRGAPELVRFWNQLPLVREPEIALFGIGRLDPPEEEVLKTSPIVNYSAKEILRNGVTDAAQAAYERCHAGVQPYVVHLDTDAIAREDFSATNLPGEGGLRLDDVRAALEVFLAGEHLTAVEVTTYNPEKDADGSAARVLVELLASTLGKRLTARVAPPAEAAAGEARSDAESGEAAPAEPGESEVAPESAPAAEATSAEPGSAPEERPASAESAGKEPPAEAGEEAPTASDTDEKPASGG